ncbi:Do family serine endopeptidase [Parvularcula dongshanensis]|uniref:Do/DeqQ family serine protease n=1 Tax=Parvularcula dongshanensis TaxID=1173995 RepID=A0A840I250_9PROT|nr:Do family serine endopeptidase [Parvularcula dongshanensis]MBB4658889.1 Do/DeqQ family serine protease [Parvularcula dongshanensis]
MRTLFAGVLFALVLPLSSAQAQTVAPPTDAALRASYAPIVEEAAPAVVNVFSERTVQTRARSMFDDPFFRDFFGDRGLGGRTRERVERSLGSGVIVDPEGVIVTNNHVVDGATAIRVVLADRREFDAEVVLADQQTDLAILRIDAEGLPALPFADSDAAEVGDVVLAIGNPFGVGQTVTSGIVSAVSRSAAGASDYQFFIQTDAAINPGNSGGALVDASGALLGVNTAIYSRSGGSNGIGFAIPGNLVRRVVASAEGGEAVVRRPWLGVQATAIDARIASALGLDRPRGALVTAVYPDGPADKAGLEEGDVVLAVADQDVFEPEALRYRPATLDPGSKAKLSILRDGKARDLTATLAFPPDRPDADERRLTGQQPLSGATVANLSPALAESLGRDPFETGVVVTDTEPGSYAARYGIGRGVVVLGVNGEETDDTKALERALAQPARLYALTLRTQDGRVTTLRVGR